MTDSPADLVIIGCTALVHDERERIGFVEDATIVVRAGVIESVGTGSLTAPRVEIEATVRHVA